MTTKPQIETLLEDLGDTLRRLRKERNLTQEELAQLSECSWITIQRLESAKVATQIDKVWQVARVLGVRLAEVLEDVEGKSGKATAKASKGIWEEMKATVDQMPKKDREWVGRIMQEVLGRE